MKTLLCIIVLLTAACGNSTPPQAPEAPAAQSDAATPAPADAGALTPDKK